MSPIGVIGAGAFGTALACALARPGREVRLWGRDADKIAWIEHNRNNNSYLPGVKIPDTLTPTSDLAALSDVSTLLLALPSQQLRSFLAAQNLGRNTAPIVLCAKGIELETGKLQSEILAERLPGARVAVITGPGFAVEIAVGKPTALTLACDDADLGAELQNLLSTPSLRLYLTNDLTGAQLGGALKNVIAIACGIVVGAGLGESARAALMTRGFAEISRLAQALGGDSRTLIGLSGFGDLALTCTSNHSRNFAFGRQLAVNGVFGQGKTVEGIATARATCELAAINGIEMPISQVVADVLAQKLTVPQALETLMSRPLKKEI